MTRYAIALGSNVGDRIGHLRSAVDEIGGLGDGLTVSGLYETAPVGGPEQGPYLNTVVTLETALSPAEMLERLQAIEGDHDRERVVRWGPRTLDLDIVSMDPGEVHTPMLEIPHPRAPERRFVLEPLCEVWPDAAVGGGLTAAEARELVPAQDVDLLATRWVVDGRKPGRYWVGAQVLLFLAIAVALVMDGSLPWAEYPEVELAFGRTIYGWRIAGVVLLAIGAVGLVGSARSLGPALTALPEPVEGAELVETGLFAHARHPIYGSVCLMMLGAALMVASTAAALLSLLLPMFFWAKSSYEEKQLRIRYPGYAAYAKRVRHRLIPFIL